MQDTYIQSNYKNNFFAGKETKLHEVGVVKIRLTMKKKKKKYKKKKKKI